MKGNDMYYEKVRRLALPPTVAGLATSKSRAAQLKSEAARWLALAGLMSLCVLSLAGCAGEKPHYRLNAKNTEAWQPKAVNAAGLEVETASRSGAGTEFGSATVSPLGAVVQPASEAKLEDENRLHAEIIGLSLVKGADESADAEDVGTSSDPIAAPEEQEGTRDVWRLEEGETYLVEARVFVLPGEFETWEDLTLTFGFPQTVKTDERSVLTCCAESIAYKTDATYSVTAPWYDLHLDYVPDSCVLTEDDITRGISDERVTLRTTSDGAMANLTTVIPMPSGTGILECRFAYQVKASLENGQTAELRDREENPIQVQLVGIATGDGDAPVLQNALQECLREDYIFPETVAPTDQICTVARVKLPDWAMEFAQKYGLMLEWYHNISGQRDGHERRLTVRLKSCPENYCGSVDFNFEIDSTQQENGLVLSSVVTDPVSFWRINDDNPLNYQLVDNSQAKICPISFELVETEDGELWNVTQLSINSEVVSQLGDDFYLASSTQIYQNEEVEEMGKSAECPPDRMPKEARRSVIIDD